MITLISAIVEIFLKALSIGAKIALNRATVIITFVLTIGGTISLIYNSLSDTSSVLSTAVGKVTDISSQVADWAVANSYVQLIGYSLSLDVLVDGLISFFFWIVCTLGGFLLTALIGVFFAVLPLLSDLAVSAIKHQFASSASLK